MKYVFWPRPVSLINQPNQSNSKSIDIQVNETNTITELIITLYFHVTLTCHRLIRNLDFCSVDGLKSLEHIGKVELTNLLLKNTSSTQSVQFNEDYNDVLPQQLCLLTTRDMRPSDAQHTQNSVRYKVPSSPSYVYI